MNRALVAIDHSEISKSLIAFAFDFARNEKLDGLDFLHVVEQTYYVGEGVPIQSVEKLEENAQRHFSEIIEEMMKETSGSPVSYRLTVDFGSPAAEIIDRAEREKHDIILIGHQGLSRLERFLVGSVALRVIAHAPCRVLVFR